MKMRRATSWLPVSATAVVVGISVLAGVSIQAQQKPERDKDLSIRVQSGDTEAGLIVSAKATAKDVGLPLYPGAIPHNDEGKHDAAATVGLWSNAFGFKLIALKMESIDSPRKIAEFYQRALAKYGMVLDCTNAEGTATDTDDRSDRLTCADDRPERGKTLFKAGTKHRQHLVGVWSGGDKTIFQLIYIEG